MGDLGPLKFIVGAGVILLAFLMGLGLFASGEGEKQRDLARDARTERREMFNNAMQQAREAQNSARMHMEHNMRMMEAAEYDGMNYRGVEEQHSTYDPSLESDFNTPSDFDTSRDDQFGSESDSWDSDY
jgi:hypothetical protein